MSADGARWHSALLSSLAPPPDTIGRMAFSFADGTSYKASAVRYWRFSILTRDVSPQAASHSWIKEVQFRRKAPPSPAPTPKVQIEMEYALYYMPHTLRGSRTGLSVGTTWKNRTQTAAAPWLAAHNLTAAALGAGAFRTTLPQVTNVTLQDRNDFESRMPMELVATAAEQAAMQAAAGCPAGT